MDQKRQQVAGTLDIKSAQQVLGVGYRLVDRYFRESGLELPRPKSRSGHGGGKRVVPAEPFLAWVEGGRR